MAARDRRELLPTLTAWRRPAPEPGRIQTFLATCGVRFIVVPGGWAYADCPSCGTFAGLTLDADGRRWRSGCGCYGRRPLGEPEALAVFHWLAGHAA